MNKAAAKNTLKVGIIQMSVAPGDKEANLKKAERLIREAAKAGAQMTALPELWNCGYRLERLETLAETQSGESVQLLRKLAAELGIFILGAAMMNGPFSRSFAQSSIPASSSMARTLV